MSQKEVQNNHNNHNNLSLHFELLHTGRTLPNYFNISPSF